MEPRQKDQTGALASAMSDLDPVALASWMEGGVPGFVGPLTVEQFSGGQSNPTYRLSSPSGSYVLRRQPFGELLPGAHRIDREVRVMSALGTVGFAVPHVYSLCQETAPVGASFYIMDLVEGEIFWDGGLPSLAPAERGQIYASMNRTLATLHSIDPADVGLGNYGRSANYLQRQIERWSGQYISDTEAGRSPAMDRLVEWLPRNAPANEDVSIVHGDFRIDNLIFSGEQRTVLAVLDWELSTLGNPLVDLAYHLMMYRVPSVVPWGLADRDLLALGIPSEVEYIGAYCQQTGRSGIDDLPVFLAFNFFRFAAIIHGIKGRMIRGNASSAEADKLVQHLDLFAELGCEQIDSLEREA